MLSNSLHQNARHTPTLRQRVACAGFSLIEVMIVLVIIGTLLLVALPGYQESMRKSHRADGMRDLMELVSRQERFYAQNSRYTDVIKTAAGLNFIPWLDPGEPFDGVDEPTLSTEGRYALSVVECTGFATDDFSSCYELRATPLGEQEKDACGTLTINSKGERGHTGSPEITCW